MPSADQLKALIESHGEGDDERFYSVALQAAARAARSGHSRLAQELRTLIDQARTRVGRPTKPIPVVQPRGDLAGLLSATYPKARLPDLVLDERVLSRLTRVLTEQRQRDHLLHHGFGPVRKLLLMGPPGTGKTMTAAVLAGELALPLFTIQLHSLITKFMGETAAKLRVIFDAISQSRGVYFFDEVDALAGERASRNDVGEIRRVLNSFLQFLEQDDSDSLLVAATNHPDLLDRALFRRFDDVIKYALPDKELLERVIRSRLATLDTGRVEWASVLKVAQGLSHADLSRACERAAKDAILAHTKEVSTSALVAAITERKVDRAPS